MRKGLSHGRERERGLVGMRVLCLERGDSGGQSKRCSRGVDDDSGKLILLAYASSTYRVYFIQMYTHVHTHN